MHAIVSFFKRTAIGGVLFLLPLALFVFLIGQLFALLRPAAVKLAEYAGAASVGPFWLAAALVPALIICSFLAGLLASTFLGRRLVEGLETVVLNRVPGYGIIKSAAAEAASSMAAIEQKRAVLVADNDSWQIGFVTDEVSEDVWAVFIPEAPSPESGSLVLIRKDRIVDSGLSVFEALACLRRVGTHMPKLPIHEQAKQATIVGSRPLSTGTRNGDSP